MQPSDQSKNDPMIRVRDLVKIFMNPDGGQKRAVDGLSFSVDAGQIYGLLGPNGAGKTTTLRIISGLMAPTSGSARLAGYEVTTDPLNFKQVPSIIFPDRQANIDDIRNGIGIGLMKDPDVVENGAITQYVADTDDGFTFDHPGFTAIDNFTAGLISGAFPVFQLGIKTHNDAV